MPDEPIIQTDVDDDEPVLGEQEALSALAQRINTPDDSAATPEHSIDEVFDLLTSFSADLADIKGRLDDLIGPPGT